MQTTIFNPCHLAAKRDTHTDWRGGQVPHIDADAHRVIAFVEEWLHRIASRHFEVADHVGRAEHPCSFNAQEVDRVFVGDEDGGFVSCTDGNVDHRDIIGCRLWVVGCGKSFSYNPQPTTFTYTIGIMNKLLPTS